MAVSSFDRMLVLLAPQLVSIALIPQDAWRVKTRWLVSFEGLS